MSEEKKNFFVTYSQTILAGAVLLAAIIISGTIIFTSSRANNSGLAQVGGGDTAKPTPQPVVDIKIGDGDHVLGNKDAKATVVLFTDFRCPFCERFFKQTEQQLINDYVKTGKASFVFKNFAFLGQESIWASEAAECAADQGKFWEFHDWLYNNQAPESDLSYYSKTNLVKYATKVGLNTNQFSSCLNSDKYAKRVSDDLAEGQKYGVSGTPTIFVNGKKIVGAQPYDTFKAAIEDASK